VDEERTMVISIAYNRTSKGWVVVAGEEATFHTTRSDAYSTALEMARNAVRTESVTVVYEGLDDLEVE
jgi:uridylate kinase